MNEKQKQIVRKWIKWSTLDEYVAMWNKLGTKRMEKLISEALSK